MAYGKGPFTWAHHSIDHHSECILYHITEHANGTTSVGDRNPWTSHGCSVSIRIGCPRMSDSDYQLICGHRVCTSISSFMYEKPLQCLFRRRWKRPDIPGYSRVRKLCCKGKLGLTHVVSVWWPLAVFYLVTTVFRESRFSGFIVTLRGNGWQSWSRPFSLQPMGSGTRPRCPTICVLHTVFASRMPAEPCEIQQVLPRCHWRDALRGRILDLVAYSVTLTIQVRARTI